MQIQAMPFTRAELFLIEKALKNYRHEVRISEWPASSTDVKINDLQAKVSRTIDMMV